MGLAHIKQSGLMSDTRVKQVPSAIRLGLFSFWDGINAGNQFHGEFHIAII
jgi:hypothetical protein